MGEVNKLRTKQSTKMHINYEDKVYTVAQSKEYTHSLQSDEQMSVAQHKNK